MDVVEANIALTPFDRTDVVTVQPSLLGQGFLGQTPLAAELANPVAEGPAVGTLATLVTTEFIQQMESNRKNPGRPSSGRGVKTGSLVVSGLVWSGLVWSGLERAPSAPSRTAFTP